MLHMNALRQTSVASTTVMVPDRCIRVLRHPRCSAIILRVRLTYLLPLALRLLLARSQPPVPTLSLLQIGLSLLGMNLYRPLYLRWKCLLAHFSFRPRQRSLGLAQL